MDETIARALKTDSLIDIITTGRKTGNQHRIEIVFHNFDDELYITGMPGRKRDWYANLAANPRLIFCLKQSVQAEIPATATLITDEASRRQILSQVVAKWNRQHQLEAFVQDSPLIKVQLD